MRPTNPIFLGHVTGTTYIIFFGFLNSSSKYAFSVVVKASFPIVKNPAGIKEASWLFTTMVNMTLG